MAATIDYAQGPVTPILVWYQLLPGYEQTTHVPDATEIQLTDPENPIVDGPHVSVEGRVATIYAETESGEHINKSCVLPAVFTAGDITAWYYSDIGVLRLYISSDG